MSCPGGWRLRRVGHWSLWKHPPKPHGCPNTLHDHQDCWLYTRKKVECKRSRVGRPLHQRFEPPINTDALAECADVRKGHLEFKDSAAENVERTKLALVRQLRSIVNLRGR